jgi:hypothetical protein
LSLGLNDSIHHLLLEPSMTREYMTEDPRKSRARHLRWRDANREKWKRMRMGQKKRYYVATRKHNRSRFKKWTAEEDRRIIAKRRPTDRELSITLGRSMRAICARRMKLREAHKVRKGKKL